MLCDLKQVKGQPFYSSFDANVKINCLIISISLYVLAVHTYSDIVGKTWSSQNDEKIQDSVCHFGLHGSWAPILLYYLRLLCQKCDFMADALLLAETFANFV